MIAIKEYEIKDLEKLLNKSRTQILRLAVSEGWTVSKKKIGKVYRNIYSAEDVHSYLNSKEKKEKTVTRTVAKKEATAIDELPTWNQRVANARYILCIKLEEAYYENLGKKEDTIKKFLSEVFEKYPNQMAIIKNISLATLRRWYGIYQKNRNNPLALSSGHGATKGIRRVDKEVLKTVRSLFLNKNKPKMTVVFQKVVEQYGLGAISYGTLRNYIKYDLNIIEKDKGRLGEKEFKDKHIPYIVRSYEDLKANDIWMSDGHDLEMMCYCGKKKKSNGERYFGSPKLIIWIDVKSRLITGWTLSWAETSESIAIALKRGIEKYGVPKKIYTDNGKAYTSKVLKGTEELDGIYASLGVEVSHALPYNAQAKHIERWFVDFKESFTKDFLTYKGGNVIERPEHMKSFAMKKLERGAILEQEELEQEIERFIEKKNHYYYALRRAAGLKAHRGRGMNGKTPLEVFEEENPVSKRVMLSEEKLRLLFLYEETRTIQQNGIEYLGNTYTNELLYFHHTEKVKIKYDPHNLDYIYVYLDTGEYLCKAKKLNPAGWNDVTAIKTHKRNLKKLNKLSKEIIGIREEIREETNTIAWQSENEKTTLKYNKMDIEDAEVIENDKTKVYIGNGLYTEIK